MNKEISRAILCAACFIAVIVLTSYVIMGSIQLAAGGDFQRCTSEALAKGHISNVSGANVRVDFWNICVVTDVKFENGTSAEVVIDSWKML